MTDDTRRPLTPDERARIHAARRNGGMCAVCGRAFLEGETIWMEPIAVHDEYGGTTHWRVPVGAECASPETIRATCSTEPERCAGCGRGVYYGATAPGRARRRQALCSRLCGRKRAAPSSRPLPATSQSAAHDMPAADVPPWER